jgi:hypothetical protein
VAVNLLLTAGQQRGGEASAEARGREGDRRPFGGTPALGRRTRPLDQYSPIGEVIGLVIRSHLCATRRRE